MENINDGQVNKAEGQQQNGHRPLNGTPSSPVGEYPCCHRQIFRASGTVPQRAFLRQTD